MNGYKKIEIKLDREKADMLKNEWETNDEVFKVKWHCRANCYYWHIRHTTCVGDPYRADGNTGQLDHLALQELEPGVAQVLARQLLENRTRVWSRDAQHADLVRDVADADVVAAVRRLRLDPPEYRRTEEAVS